MVGSQAGIEAIIRPPNPKIVMIRIMANIFETFPTPNMLSITIQNRKVKMVGNNGKCEKTVKYAPIPIKEKAAFRRIDKNNPKPTTVPTKGPNVLST